MDYRLQAVIDSARSAKTYAVERASAQRSRTVDSVDVDASREIAIARLSGEATAYQWVIDQLASFEREIPAAGGDAGGSKTTDQTSSGHSGGSWGGCGVCSRLVRDARAIFDTMCSEAGGYGWNDSDTQRYKNSLGLKLDEIANGQRQH